MTAANIRRALRVIRDYELHAGSPVSLRALEDRFPVRFDDLGGMDVLGMILTPPRGWNARPDNPARVILNSGLGPMDARVAYAHEVGHGLCHHVGMMSSLALGLEDKHEREAWEIASLLLIPERVVLEEKEVVRIAAACEVPEWLVEIWPLISV